MGVWTIWEPNAYDGRDQIVAQSKPVDAAAIPQDNLEMVFSTESGAVNIYWVREGGNIVPVTGSDSQRQEPYYAEPFNSTAPAFPAYTDESIGQLMVSVCVPIMLDGKVLGVVGVDIGMNKIQADLAALHP